MKTKGMESVVEIELILSQGRIADRKNGTIEGARRTAGMLAEYLGQEANVVGRPSPAAVDDWSESLPAAMETLNALQNAVTNALAARKLPLMIANTCSASLASLPVVARQQPDACILWVDAHGDFNTPDTTESGYLGGMVLAGACGLWESGLGGGLNPECDCHRRPRHRCSRSPAS